MIRLYSLTEDGQVLTQQAVAIPGGRRCISSISFGHNYYWDVLAAGAEATDREGVHGQVKNKKESTFCLDIRSCSLKTSIVND